ncbi:MAG: ABC transporter permease [Bacteroidota bacterium]
MRTISFILYKEFRQIFRNKALLPIIFIAPIVQLIILAYAANFEVKNLQLFLVDRDQSPLSERLIGKFQGSPYFQLVGASFNPMDAEDALKADEADIILQIPAGFERGLFREDEASLQLLVNAIDGVKGGLASAYAGQLIQAFNQEIRADYGPQFIEASLRASSSQMELTYSHWFNPKMDYKTFMVPGILALLVTMVGSFLCAMNIVREKEMGTIEQINVTPIRKYQFIIGKLLPFLVIGLVMLSIGLMVGWLLYDIPFEGSIALLYGVAVLYLGVILGLGLLVSTFTETQQQAMFISWFFLVIFIFLSGMFTAIENMPDWAQQITYLNPVRYFIEVIRSVMLKGSGWQDIQFQITALSIYAVVINTLAVMNYRKRS